MSSIFFNHGESNMSAHLPLSFPRPLVAVDVVIFSIQDDQLKVLLVRRKVGDDALLSRQWTLVGGFVNVDMDENLEATALRKLKEKTGVTSPYLEQLGSWGGKHRDPRGWSTTHVYFALIPSSNLAPPQHGGNAEDAQWVKVEGHGVTLSLAFDHGEILEAALNLSLIHI